MRARGVEFDTVEYLKTPLHRATFERIVAMLDTPPAEMVRKDRRFEELGLKATDYVTAEAVVALLVKHPELMQRPVIVKADKAVIARPPERLLAQLYPTLVCAIRTHELVIRVVARFDPSGKVARESWRNRQRFQRVNGRYYSSKAKH